jgi:hypothetical protein
MVNKEKRTTNELTCWYWGSKTGTERNNRHEMSLTRQLSLLLSPQCAIFWQRKEAFG